MGIDLNQFNHIPSIQPKAEAKPIKELAIQKYLKKYGIDKAREELGLKIKEYPFTIHLKYDQLLSDMKREEVRECRGLILAKTPYFQVVSYGFKKFFNFGEGNADTIDWRTAKVLTKVDGSLIMLYYNPFTESWCAGTTGTAEGEGEVTNSVTTLPFSFKDLFFRALEETVQRSDGMAKEILNTQGRESYLYNNYRPGLTYMFELTSPSNTVVTPHKINEVRLLSVRNCQHTSPEYLKEAEDPIMDLISDTIAVPLVKLLFRGWETDIDKLKDSFDNMPFTEEGYVVVDKQHNRIKLKNPSYVEAHFLKHKQKRHQIIKVIKTNETEEFIAAFPEKESILKHLNDSYVGLYTSLDEQWDAIKSLFSTDEEYNDKKLFALKLQSELHDKRFISYFYQRHQNKITSALEYLEKYNDKDLYLYLVDGYVGVDK